MRRPNSGKRKLFSVVRFLETDFIDKYICVPRSWILLRMTDNKKAAVAYPINEDPLTTKDRVKRKERPDAEWRAYKTVIAYESVTFEDANNWIETQNDNKRGEIKNSGTDMKDSQPETIVNKKLRSASLPFFFDTKFNKPSISGKRYRKPRNSPFSRISIKMPTTLSLVKKYTKQDKLHEIAKSVSPVNHPRTVSEHSNDKQLVSNNQLIQSAQSGTAPALDDKTSSESTLPDFIKGDKAVMSDQSAFPKLPHKNQPSPASQTGEQCMDGDDHVDDVADHVQYEPLMEDAIFPGKTPSNCPEQVLQSEPVNLSLQDVPARQSKKVGVDPKTQLFQVLTSHTTVPRPSSRPNELTQGKYPQLEILPSTSATHLNPPQPGTNGGSSTEVAYNHPTVLSQSFINNTLFMPHYVTNQPMNPPVQLHYPSLKKKSSSAPENPVAKRIYIENITRKTSTRQDTPSSTAQIHLTDNFVVKPVPHLAQKHPKEVSRQPISNARSDFGANAINPSISQQGMTAYAAQNLSNLAQHSHSFMEQSHIQHYLLMQKYHLEQTARLNSTFEQPNIGHSTDRYVHLPRAVDSEFTLQSTPNSFGSTNQHLSQHSNQYGLLNKDSMQEIQRHEITRWPICGPHTNSATMPQNIGSVIQFPTQNSLNHYNFENLEQRQDPPRYQDLSGPSLYISENPQQTERQGVIKRSPALLTTPSQPFLNAERGYLLRDSRVRVKLNQNPAEHQILDPVVSGRLVNEVESTSVDAEIQTAPLPDSLNKAPSALLPGTGIVYQNPRTKKLVVDQATETNPVKDADHCEDEVAESFDKSAPQVVESGCQTDGYFVEEQVERVLMIETDSESEISTHDIVSDRNECEDHTHIDTVSNESRPTIPQHPQKQQSLAAEQETQKQERLAAEQETQKQERLAAEQETQKQQRLAAEEEMLNMLGTLLTQLGASFHCTRDLFNHLRNSILKCAELYESLLEKIEKFNKEGQLQIPTSMPKISEASQENISENSSAKNITGISSAPKMNHPQKNAFVLPPEYDPNDSKWTLKYQKKAPGLVELITGSNVYVSKKELKNCKRESRDGRTLARMLLTEVFSRNALSVCSLTGGKAKAFSSLNLDVRPGLDEHARMVLLTFVERYGCGWKKLDDTAGIISSICTKIREMREKYGQAHRVL